VRVIAGSVKGRRLVPAPEGVRPVSDRVREGLFSSLADRVEGAHVLDLYAGTGALGIEALSRGAADAVFVERDRRAVAAIRQNLARTALEDRARVLHGDAVRSLEGSDGSYDLVFADPPYESDPTEVERALAVLVAKGLLRDGFTVAVTRGRRSSTLVIPVDWSPARRLAYGDSLVTLFR
jgi:16S rRNA (guanine966-N2)-methyltransferase